MNRRARHLVSATLALVLAGCATIRVSDPPRTATEQFLLSEAAIQACDRLSSELLRDREVFIDTTYLSTATGDSLFLIGEVRARLLLGGIRLVDKRDRAKIVVELRSGGLGIDRLEYLVGIPAFYLPNLAGGTSGNVPLATPELAIVKSTKQYGYASVAFVAYWADTGEVVASSGPFIGRTWREDYWFFGFGPRTDGNIPPARR